MSAANIPLWRRRARHLILLSSSGPSDNINTILANLPPSDPPSELSSSDKNKQSECPQTLEDIPLHKILKREVDRESSPNLDYNTPLQRLFCGQLQSSSLPQEVTAPMLSSENTVIFTPRTERRIQVAAGQVK
jgi:hypothetical protein